MSPSPAERRTSGTAWRLRFRVDESINDGFHRILGALTDEMVAILIQPEQVGNDTAIHDVRRMCKQARALLRLVRPATRDHFTAVDRSYRDAGRSLASARDSRVLVKTLDRIRADDDLSGGAETYGEVRAFLDNRAIAVASMVLSGSASGATGARRMLEQGLATAASMTIPDGPSAIADGATRTYTQGHKALRQLSQERTPSVFHRWRIRVKQRRHQVAFIEDRDPSALAGLHERLYELSDLLGDAHDLFVFSEHLEETVSGVQAAGELHRLAAIADRNREELESLALEIGRTVFKADPQNVRKSLITGWATRTGTSGGP